MLPAGRTIRCDLHSDIMMDILPRWQRGEPDPLRTRHLSPLREAGLSAVVVSVGGDWHAMMPGDPDPTRLALQMIDCLFRLVDAGTEFAVAGSAAEIETAVSEGRIALVLALEGGRPLAGDLGMLRTFHRLGVRVLGLTHRYRNELGDGNGEAHTGSRLTRMGRAVVAAAQDLGILLDLSHLNDAGVDDVLRFAARPVIASHSNARAVCDHVRNLTDEHVARIADGGGLIGVTPVGPYLREEGSPSIADLLRHLEHLVRVVGVDHVGVGTDFVDYLGERYIDDISYPPEFCTTAQWSVFVDSLASAGWTEGDLQGILGGNFLRVFREAGG